MNIQFLIPFPHTVFIIPVSSQADGALSVSQWRLLVWILQEAQSRMDWMFKILTVENIWKEQGEAAAESCKSHGTIMRETERHKGRYRSFSDSGSLLAHFSGQASVRFPKSPRSWPTLGFWSHSINDYWQPWEA